MFKNTLIHFASWTLLQLLVKVNCQIQAGHTATLIDNKLYILGGLIGTGLTNEFFYLDFSAKFNTKDLSWHNLTSGNIVPPHDSAASVRGGISNNTLFLYGGYAESPMKLVYTFDPSSNTWSIPTIASGINVIKKTNLLGIVDYGGKMYLWGGNDETHLDINDMLILDTINLSWNTGSLVGAPSARSFYGATLLPNQSIIYIGGYDRRQLPLNQVYIYDTINDKWSTETTSGRIPSDRHGFSVVLGLDGQRIIIFGGPTQPSDSLYVLGLDNFEWYIPKTSGQIPSSRYAHTANVIGKFMAISFGVVYDQLSGSDILLLDISNNEEYIWTDDFLPSSPSTTALTPSVTSNFNQPSVSKVIGAVIGSLFAAILLPLLLLFGYRWNKKKKSQKNTIPTPGSERREGMINSVEKDSCNPRQDNIHSSLIPFNKKNKKYGQEISPATKNVKSTTNHEIITIPAQEINTSDNHGQKAIPLSAQNINDLKNEIKQDIIREVLQNLQNNAQASSSNQSNK